MRQEPLAYGEFRGVEFFSLATPDRLYVWIGRLPIHLVEPNYEVDAHSFFKPYLDRAGSTREISSHAFEMVVDALWLADLAEPNGSEEEPPTDRGWLTEFGFRMPSRNGWVEK